MTACLGWAFLALVLAKWAAQFWLDRLNRAAAAHAGVVPEAFATLDAPTYAKSVAYTLAKGGLHEAESAWEALVLALVLCAGWLPGSYRLVTTRFGESAWVMAAFLIGWAMAFTLVELPLAWHAQFRIEERFGFNTTTPRLWGLDRLKGLLLALALGGPLLVLILKLVEWTGSWWWLWAWGCVLSVQLVVTLLAPVLILPCSTNSRRYPTAICGSACWRWARARGSPRRVSRSWMEASGRGTRTPFSPGSVGFGRSCSLTR